MDLLALAEPGTGLLHSQDLAAAGVDRHALDAWLATGLLLRVGRGSFITTAVWQLLDDVDRHLVVARCALRRSPTAVLAAVSAAAAHRLPLPPRSLPGPPVLLRPRTKGRPEGGAVAATRARRAWLDDDESTEVGGLAVTTLPRTLVDLAQGTTTPWALAAADAALARPGTCREDLLAAAGRRPRAPGHRRAQFCATHADPLAESPLESAARAVVLARGLPAPRLQAWVRGASGARYRLDMLFVDWWTAVEVDGRVKYAEADAAERVWSDKRRQDDVTDTGLEMVRFVAADLTAPHAFLQRFLTAVRRAHLRRALTPPPF